MLKKTWLNLKYRVDLKKRKGGRYNYGFKQRKIITTFLKRLKRLKKNYYLVRYIHKKKKE